MKCPKCQFENRDVAKFCGKCAAKLEVICSQCGNTNPPDINFCDGCGHDLREVKSGLPIDYSQPQSYTPKVLADKILTTRSSIEGERKLVTVLFTDVANYTSMSEKLDPEEVHQIMDGCFKILMDEIHRYEGTIDKFTGDGVMALFGAPVAHEDHAQRACHAALAIQRAMGEYSEKIEKECGIDFKIRVGLNSGPVIVGSVGNDLRMDYTAIGDTTNLASRMESMAQPGTVLVSADTHRMTRDYFNFESLGEVEIKGKEEPVEAYRLIEASEVETRIGASVARGLTPFVGRRRELETLKESFEKARSGQGQVVGVVGDAGVGKSRLILEMKGMIPKEECSCLEGDCLHYGGSMAYLPFLDMLRNYFDIKEADREFLIKKKIAEKIDRIDARLRGILPPLHEILSLSVEDEDYLKLDLQKKRELTFEAIRDLLIRESQERPVVIVIEDLHWIDRTSEDFLSYLIGWLAGARILLVLIYRPEYTHQWGSKSYYSQVRVDQLSTGTSAELVKSILEEGEMVSELRELILSRAAGNPLFMEEFTHSLLENGSIQRKDNQFVLSRKASDIHVPDTIQGIIAARMDRMEESLKRIMQVASVIGREFAFRILQSIIGMQEELKSHLLNLQGLEFIYEKNLFPELEYIFKHALTQEVAYNSLLLKRRKEIHQKIGKAIEDLYSDKLEDFYETLAFHYKQGESFDKALDYLIKAGEKSHARYALEESHHYFEEAFDILSGKPGRTEEEDALLIDLLIKWALVFFDRGDWMGMTNLLSAHQELAESLGDKARLGMFYVWLGTGFLFRGKTKDSYQYLSMALKLGEEIEDQKVIGYACTQLIWVYWDFGLMDEAIAYGERAQEISKSLESDYYLYERFMTARALVYFLKGDVKKVLPIAEAMLEYGQRHSSNICLVCGQAGTGMSYFMNGDFPSAIEYMKKAVEVSANPSYAQAFNWALGMFYLMNGQFQEAKDPLQQLVTHSEKFSYECWATPAKMYLGIISIAEGHMDQGLKMIEAAQRLFIENGRKVFYAQSEYLLGNIYLQMVEKSAPVKLTTVIRNIGFLAKNLPFAKKKAEDHLNKAIELFREIGAKAMMGMAYLDLGTLHSTKGEKARARECISTAIELFEQCELENSLKQAREALASLE